VKQQEASERAKCRSYALAKVIAAGWFPANALTFKPAAETSVCMGNASGASAPFISQKAKAT